MSELNDSNNSVNSGTALNNKKKLTKKYYAVAHGLQPGIYDNWRAAQKQVDGFSGACHKSFVTKSQAEAFMVKSNSSQFKYYGTGNAHDSTAEIDHLNSSQNNYICMNSSIDEDTLRKTIDSPAKDDSCVNCKRLSIVIEELICRLSDVEKRIQLLQKNETEFDTKSSFASRLTNLEKSQSVADQRITNLANFSCSFSNAARIVPESPQSKSSAISTPNNPSLNRAKNIHKTTSNSIEFQPNKCVVICDIPKEKIVAINQDIVRKELNTKFGPLMIDIVNRYKFHSATPKFIVQFADASVIPSIIDRWDSTLFGNSSVRRTIKPCNNIGMIRGVPLDLSEDAIYNDIKDAYPNASLYRLKSNDNKPLRTVKITVNDEESLKHMIKTGLLVKSMNLLLRVEMPYSTSKPAENETVDKWRP